MMAVTAGHVSMDTCSTWSLISAWPMWNHLLWHWLLLLTLPASNRLLLTPTVTLTHNRNKCASNASGIIISIRIQSSARQSMHYAALMTKMMVIVLAAIPSTLFKPVSVSPIIHDFIIKCTLVHIFIILSLFIHLYIYTINNKQVWTITALKNQSDINCIINDVTITFSRIYRQIAHRSELHIIYYINKAI